MTRNLDNLRDITTFLMMQNSNPSKGYTAREIADAVPSLKESSVYRIIRANPQFVQTTNSIHPKRYYFDPMRVKVVANKAGGKLQIRPELEVTPKPVLDFLQGLIANTKGEDSPLYKEVKRIGTAANNAMLFQTNQEPLEPALWASAKNSIDVLESFAATLYQRIYELKSDDRYDSPEWWAIFSKEQ